MSCKTEYAWVSPASESSIYIVVHNLGFFTAIADIYFLIRHLPYYGVDFDRVKTSLWHPGLMAAYASACR